MDGYGPIHSYTALTAKSFLQASPISTQLFSRLEQGFDIEGFNLRVRSTGNRKTDLDLRRKANATEEMRRGLQFSRNQTYGCGDGDRMQNNGSLGQCRAGHNDRSEIQDLPVS